MLIQHTFEQWYFLGRLPFFWTGWISRFHKYNVSALANWDLFLAELKDYQFAPKQLSKFGRNGMFHLLTGWLGQLVPNKFPWLHVMWYWFKCFCCVLCSKSPSSQINKGIHNFDLYHPNLLATCFWLLESNEVLRIVIIIASIIVTIIVQVGIKPGTSNKIARSILNLFLWLGDKKLYY